VSIRAPISTVLVEEGTVLRTGTSDDARPHKERIDGELRATLVARNLIPPPKKAGRNGISFV
jgi:hypothetical protein